MPATASRYNLPFWSASGGPLPQDIPAMRPDTMPAMLYAMGQGAGQGQSSPNSLMSRVNNGWWNQESMMPAERPEGMGWFQWLALQNQDAMRRYQEAMSERDMRRQRMMVPRSSVGQSPGRR